jgi:hypothetical protein
MNLRYASPKERAVVDASPTEFDALEARAMLAVGGVVPANFIGPPQPGWVRAAVPLDIVHDLTYNPNPPWLGEVVQVTLHDIWISKHFHAVSTKWTDTIAYGGLTTPVGTMWGGGLSSCGITTVIPGTYTITAVTTYASDDGGPPPPPVTDTGSFQIAPPDDAVKGGPGLGVPTEWMASVNIEDPVKAGGGSVGSYFYGLAQQDLTDIVWWDGTKKPDSGWMPEKPNPDFLWTNGVIYELMSTGLGPFDWAPLKVGATCTFTQKLRFEWPFNSTKGLVYFVSSVFELDWTFTKVDANDWKVS